MPDGAVSRGVDIEVAHIKPMPAKIHSSKETAISRLVSGVLRLLSSLSYTFCSSTFIWEYGYHITNDFGYRD